MLNVAGSQDVMWLLISLFKALYCDGSKNYRAVLSVDADNVFDSGMIVVALKLGSCYGSL